VLSEKENRHIVLISVLLVSMVLLTACKDKEDEYEDYLGIYECIHAGAAESGFNVFGLSYYEYYTIELKRNGVMTLKYKNDSFSTPVVELDFKFEIDGEKFFVTKERTKSDPTGFTRQYTIRDNVIRMQGLHLGTNSTNVFTVEEFKRTVE
jgi:hypothetical protein